MEPRQTISKKQRTDELEIALTKRLQSDLDGFLRDETFEASPCVSKKRAFSDPLVWRYVAVGVLCFLSLGALLRFAVSFYAFRADQNEIVESNPYDVAPDSSGEDLRRNSLIFSTEDMVNYSRDTISLIEENVESVFITPVSFSHSRENVESEFLGEGGEGAEVLSRAYSAVCSDCAVLNIDPLVRSIGVILASRDPEPSFD